MKGFDDSRLAKTSFLGNRVSRVTMRSQRKDIFLVSRGDGMHDEYRVVEALDVVI
jgi:hypothetical protein